MSHSPVADVLVRTLIEAGAERIYGVVGDSLNPITDAVRRSQGRLRWIHVRHEEAGAFAASAEAQLSGRLAVCAGSCGPGHLHLINGLYDAHRSYAPVLALVSHIPSEEIGTAYFQETHPELLFRECSHFCEMASNPKQAPRLFRLAAQAALSRGGVSAVVLPGDVAALETEDPLPPVFSTTRPVVRPPDESLEQLASLLNAASRVTVFCGSGCQGAHAEVMALARALQAPVGHAYRGKEWIAYDNPYDVGMTGLLGFGAAYEAMHACDVLLLLGTDFPYDAFMPVRPHIAQVDLRPEHLGRRSRLDLGVCGDVRETLRALLPRLEQKEDRRHLETALETMVRAREKLDKHVREVGDHRPLHPEFVAALLDEVAAEDAVFTVDTGMCNAWSARYLRASARRRIIGSFTHGSMANALPQAIGAQLLYPGRQVISMSGDGGFAMLMGDFLTLAQYELPVKVVVFDNSSLGMVKLEMQVSGYPDTETDLVNPDFAKLAEAVGILGIRVEAPGEVRGAFERALAHPGPALVDVVTDPHALSMPPRVTLKQAAGFALAMTRLVLNGEGTEVKDTVDAQLHH
ncbi:ubiquinone-dependent pyruvate dehydrogenase [Myxococcus sp. K15C18031901]|uniref:ubiquinone-dependent pyruvate dehydrogenase n=1 Tax=Myxococcus dinghuensis TaxID=2906761 RepID=UPI0020A6EC20|nr:ubiquinone-dependent pyruvate dehydrogenase [Myxococcus dinghuensis]MCP3097380.1 ubiquinone-dependent pyruvate dehydrogenase [Myxococcus dinghuensis]